MPGSIHEQPAKRTPAGHWWKEHDPWGELDGVYLDQPEQWVVLAGVLRSAGSFGLDTEFYNVDVRKQSCVGRARVHVWSVAVRTTKRSALGFAVARGFVLPSAALDCPALVAVLEDPAIKKAIHNQPVDDHTINNHGIRLKGAINTLGYARWVWPWLVTAGGFGLKNLMMVKLRRAPICEFKDVVNDERTVLVSKVKLKAIKGCSCGVAGCRKRKPALEHVRTETMTEVVETREKVEKFQHPLESIIPGHARFPLLIDYSAEDAVAALEALELMEKERPPAPFPYAAEKVRPGFNQPLEDAVVDMERLGFPVDVAYAGWQAVNAEDDEEAELVWLHRWYVANGTPLYGPHRREDVDGVWSSPKQLGEMFDDLDFPESPIWKKGRCKPGERKLDGAALKWIAKNYKPAKQVIERILRLKTIRSGKKYLLKLRDCGGWIHPICGPAGDSDDRNGALTGRLGIKGTMEMQQLPSREEADLYNVRKAIIAGTTLEST